MTDPMMREREARAVRAYTDRYEVLAKLRREESRDTSPSEKFTQFLSIMALADAAGWLDDHKR